MQPRIDVEPQSEELYRVTVIDDGSSTTHRVRLPVDQLAELGGGASAETLISASFQFLLEREPKESILAQFALSEIARYFPEYPQEIRMRLEGTVG